MVDVAGRKCILVVDDTPTNLMVTLNVLKDEYRVKIANSGAKALDIVQKEPPDLILLDVLMPEMDGYEVCKRIKANTDTAHIPIIFLTAQTSASEESTGFELGAADYIHKPFNPVTVQEKVRKHLLAGQVKLG